MALKLAKPRELLYLVFVRLLAGSQYALVGPVTGHLH